MKKRIVAIDFGMKRCGLAISNETQSMALPWTTVTGGLQSIVTTLQKRKTEIEGIIIGLPLLMNGTKGDMAVTVEKFAKTVESALQISVVLVDERLSSKHAESALRETGQNRKKRSEKTDETAATFLLQCYLDSIA
jgi:putative Holliday junction resolvase